jgi:hypothetical protein
MINSIPDRSADVSNSLRHVGSDHAVNSNFYEHVKIMGTRDHQEFKNALRDIAQHAHKLDSPFGEY